MTTPIDLAAIHDQVGALVAQHTPGSAYAVGVTVMHPSGAKDPAVTHWIFVALEPRTFHSGDCASPEIALRKLMDAIEDRQDPPPAREIGVVVVP